MNTFDKAVNSVTNLGANSFNQMLGMAGRMMSMVVIDAEDLVKTELGFGTRTEKLRQVVSQAATSYLREFQSSWGGMAMNLLPGSSLLATVGEIVSENVDMNPDVYKFRINPQKLSVDQARQVVAVSYGRNRYDLMPWGEQLVSYKYSGTTGAMLPSQVFQRLGIKDIRLSRTWLKFEAFRQFMVDPYARRGWVLVLFDMEAFLGYFESFNFSRDADEPWHINYDFLLKVDPTSRVNLVSGQIFNSNVARFASRKIVDYTSTAIRSVIKNRPLPPGYNK